MLLAWARLHLRTSLRYPHSLLCQALLKQIRLTYVRIRIHLHMTKLKKHELKAMKFDGLLNSLTIIRWFGFCCILEGDSNFRTLTFKFEISTDSRYFSVFLYSFPSLTFKFVFYFFFRLMEHDRWVTRIYLLFLSLLLFLPNRKLKNLSHIFK